MTSRKDQEETPLNYMRKQIKLVEGLAANRLSYAVKCQDYDRLIDFAKSLLKICQDTYDHLLELAPDPPLACHKGCGLCCHSHIELNPIFAFYIYEHLKQTRNKQQWEDISRKMASDERCCPLLVDDVCSIYPSRPPVCRGWYSEDVSLCEVRDFCAPQKNYDPNNAYGAQHYMVFLYVLEKRLQSAERYLGLDDKDVYLKDALTHLASSKNLGEKWLKKEEIFLGEQL